MSAPFTFTKLDTPIDGLALVCRGCLAESGEMKNIYEWGLSEDYFKATNIENSRIEGLSELLCTQCEEYLNTWKQFRERCQFSDMKLKISMTNKSSPVKKDLENEVTWSLEDQKLLVIITAPDAKSKIHLPCPFNCAEIFNKRNDLHSHLKKTHCVSKDFQIELQYYCSEATCRHHKDCDKKKWFSGRKNLNQHFNKVHREKSLHCTQCKMSFSIKTDYLRHIKTCNMLFLCQICDNTYSTNEKLMVHLLRKHPNDHKMYKDEKKTEKRKLNDEIEAKKKVRAEETETATVWFEKAENTAKSKEIEHVESPKKSLATQIPEDIRNDVTLPSWQSRTEFETKTDEISTQTVFEDLLSLKAQNSEDEIFFSETVSLSDIQTQTFPLEFGLSRSHKETQSCINSQTQSPDLSIKETQTCFCHDSPRPNFRLFESLSSSPASINLTSTETQTADRFLMKSDVLLSFNSAETQTHFDESSNDSYVTIA